MKNRFGIYEKSYSLILDTLSQYSDIDKALIFGSRTKGNFKKGSDIDIAVYGSKLNNKTVLDLSAALNERIPIPYFCDVVAPENLENQNLVEHINRLGIVFYEKK